MREKYLLAGILVLITLISVLLFYEKGAGTGHTPSEPEKEMSLENYIEGGYLKENRFSEAEYFPIAGLSEGEEFPFDNSFGGARSYGGERKHEGVDIMTRDNIRGSYPVISVCAGTITHLGWLELGGYRVGVRSDSGVYYYYAHLYRYDETIKEGERVAAGQILGYVGDSGYGEEGTTGQFDVHLHFGIYVEDEEGGELAVNPYPFLKNLTNKMIKFFD